MHIGIDYTAAAWQGAGIGRYTRELVRAIVAAAQGFRFTLFYAAGGIDRDSAYVAELRRLCDAHANVRALPIPLAPRRLTQIWQRLRAPIPVELFTGPLDLLHVPDFVAPPARARTIVTIHDLSYMVHPECAQPGLARYLGAAVPRALRHAGAVLADSEATRQDLAQLLAVDPAGVAVVYPGVNPRFRPLPREATEPVRRKHGLPERFILFVGTLEPRKNLVRLIEAFATLEARGLRFEASEDTGTPSLRTQDSSLSLVLAGRRGWLYDDIFATIARLNLGERVRVLDFVDDNDLPALYNLAWAFAFPSIYEGFGMPALEAMACGTPVVTADNSSLREVAGVSGPGAGEAAAVLVAAERVDSIAAGLARATADQSLRAELRARGFARAGRFTWEQAAHDVLEQYRAVAAR